MLMYAGVKQAWESLLWSTFEILSLPNIGLGFDPCQRNRSYMSFASWMVFRCVSITRGLTPGNTHVSKVGTGRSRTPVVTYSLTWLMWPWWVMIPIDLTGVTLAIEDRCIFAKCVRLMQVNFFCCWFSINHISCSWQTTKRGRSSFKHLENLSASQHPTISHSHMYVTSIFLGLPVELGDGHKSEADQPPPSQNGSLFTVWDVLPQFPLKLPGLRWGRWIMRAGPKKEI